MANKNDVDMLDPATTPQHGGPSPSHDPDVLQTSHSGAFAFSDSEQRALQLYYQLRELELEHTLLQAQTPDEQLQAQLITAEREAMEAKAEYELRNNISHNVLVMDPVLKAVHGGERTSHAEKRILPMMTEHDTVSMLHGSLAARLVAVQKTVGTTAQANMVARRKNRELAATMLALAEEIKVQTAKDIDDARLREQVGAVEQQVKDSRRRMKVLKGLLSAMVVGSGINWAADEQLVELVLDDVD
ncbi:centromere protein H (CENP-H)-domain-containing protein, partial [Ampelomyces quisqualis]